MSDSLFVKSNNMGYTKELHKHVEELLVSENLKEAIDTLSAYITADSDWELYTRLTEAGTSYKYMLEYFRANMPDPNRRELYRSLIGECLIINDELLITEETRKGITLYSQKRRRHRSVDITAIGSQLAENAANTAVANLIESTENSAAIKELSRKHEELLQETFYTMLTATGWKNHDYEQAYSLLTDSEIECNDRATITSAITLGMFKCFEPQKAILLYRLATDSTETEIATRALIGLIITIAVYKKRLPYYPELQYALQSLNEHDGMEKRISTIQIQLLRSRETQKINRKMREEIIPAMMKNPQLNNRKMGLNIIKEIEEDQHNPEWKIWIEQDKIKDKLNEMAQWQMEGADVYMSTFSQLKNFPFFNEMHNWMRPFDTAVPQVAEIFPDKQKSRNTILGAICSSGSFCNSDKYSFCFTFSQVPQEQRDLMMQQITDGNESAESLSEILSQESEDKKSETTGNQYIQDLYRFFKLSRYKHEFTDPFALPLNLLEMEQTTLIENPHSIKKIFNYLVEKEYYDEAYRAGTLLEKHANGTLCDAQFHQKMGYCQQKQQNYHKAVEHYIKADIITPDSLWTMRHIAQCYRLIGDLANALHYYTAALAIAPDNKTLLLQTGECKAMLKQYDEAFTHFFKVEYTDPNSLRARRAIAWCSFLTGKDEQARRYYAHIMENPKVQREDIINAAHVEWIDGNRGTALELYNRAAAMCSNIKELVSLIEEDKPILIERGATEFDLTLLKDLLY